MEDEPLPISALQHWLYCPRQCSLIHVERLWAENRFTAEGRVLHDQADRPGASRRGAVTTLRSVPLRSVTLGVSGIADIVELHDGKPFPVEYKRGRPKAHRADEVQLCAQAICLEEMFGQTVPEGALFYGQSRRRVVVTFDGELRQLTGQVAGEARAALVAGHTPAPVYERRKCDTCSLLELCRPKAMGRRSAAGWFRHRIAKAIE